MSAPFFVVRICPYCDQGRCLEGDRELLCIECDGSWRTEDVEVGLSDLTDEDLAAMSPEERTRALVELEALDPSDAADAAVIRGLRMTEAA